MIILSLFHWMDQILNPRAHHMAYGVWLFCLFCLDSLSLEEIQRESFGEESFGEEIEREIGEMIEWFCYYFVIILYFF